MLEDEGADGGFGIHHEAFGELDVDLFGAQELPESGLIFEIGTGGIAEAVAFAAIFGSEALGHGEFRRIGEAPIFAHAAMEPFGAAFRSLNRECL